MVPVRENTDTIGEFRLGLFLSSRYCQLGNGGPSSDLIKLLESNRRQVEDIFFTTDSLYILPKTREFAATLLMLCKGDKDEYGDYINREADEISWEKIDGRYWLSLWWD